MPTEHGHGHEHEHEEGRKVTITIDGTEFHVHRGRTTVADLKHIGGVAAAYDLEQVVDSRLVPLADDGAVTLKGGEVFVSHIKDGSSS